MRSFQKQTYCYVSSEFKWLEKLDFPIRYGRSIAGTDFPVSDILHVLKKLRNNNKYLSTRVLLFAYPRDISVANRLKFSARWECVVELWHSNEKFRDAISKSSVALTDKQDPSLATELFLLYPLFYEAGFNGMGLFLEMGHILFCAYYDKTLTPASRVLYASASRAIMVCWREKLLKARCVGKHFITSQHSGPPGYIRSKNEFVSLGCILNNLIGKLFPYRMQKTEIKNSIWFNRYAAAKFAIFQKLILFLFGSEN